MSVAAIKLYLSGQSPTVECDIPKIVEGSENYLGILPIRGQDWEDCNYINLSFSHEELAAPVTSTTTVRENGIAYRLVPNEVIKFPGFSLTVVGQDKAVSPTYTITTKPIYFQVDLTGQVVINSAASAAAVEVGTMTVAQEAKNTADSAYVLATSAHSKITTLSSNITSINNRITTLTGNISAINSAVTGLNNNFQNFKATTESSIIKINNTAATLRSDINKINNTVVTLNTNFNQFKNTTEASITRINNTISSINSTISDFKKTTDSSFSTLKNDVNTTISAFKSDVNTTISNINTTISSFKNDVNTTISSFKSDINTALASFTSETSAALSNSQSFIIPYKVVAGVNGADWIKDGETNNYYQIIDNDNITHNSKVDIQLDNETFYDLSNAGLVFVVKQKYYDALKKRETRIYSLGKQPEKDYSIQLEITKLKDIKEKTPIQGSPIGHLIDWNENTIRNKPTTTASDDVFSVTVSSGVCKIKLNKELYYE
jgi:hypothetical protein